MITSKCSDIELLDFLGFKDDFCLTDNTLYIGKNFFVEKEYYRNALYRVRCFVKVPCDFSRLKNPNGGPSYLEFYKCTCGSLSSGDRKCCCRSGGVYNKAYYKNGTLHRFGNPASIYYNRNGLKMREKYVLHGKTHNRVGPACRRFSGCWENTFYIHGKRVSFERFIKGLNL